MLAGQSAAAESAAKRIFNVPAGEAEASLKLFSEQSGQGVIFPTEKLKGVRTNEVRGEFTAGDAIQLLTQDTPLVVTRDAKTGAYAVRHETKVEAKNVSRAIAESGRPEPSGRTEVDEKGEPVVKLDTFEVFGKKTLNMDIRRSRDDAQPYVVFDKDRIERSGAMSVHDFLKNSLTMATSPISQSQFGSSQALSGNTSSINLRGLGTGETLILVDGHRLAALTFAGGPAQPDLNGLPLSAIERIEVLPNTASGIYGGSATGGVINIVLRRDYVGAEARLTYANSFRGDIPEMRADLSAGFSLEGGRTQVLLAAGYAESEPLLMSDRDFAIRGRNHILAVSPASILNAASPPLGATTNVRSLAGNLTLKSTGASLNSPITSVPAGYGGRSTDGGEALRANAGQYNLALANTAQPTGGGKVGLLNAPTVESVMFTVRREMTPWLQLFVDLSASNNTGEFRDTPVTSTFDVPATAAGNPFNQNVRVTTPALGVDGEVVATVQSRKAVAGAIAKLGADWTAELDYTWHRTRLARSRSPVIDMAAAAAAIASGQLDVFQDVHAVSFAPFLRPAPQFYSPPIRTTLNDATVRVSGPVGTMAGRRTTVSGLIEYREEMFDDFYNITQTGATPSFTLFPRRSQSVASAYLEAKLPLVSPERGVPGIRTLEAQLAVRGDRYVTNGANVVSIVNGVPSTAVTRTRNELTSVDPTVALRWEIVRDVTLRGSYGTGFLPPAVNQLVPTSSPTTSALTDPRRGNATLGQITLNTGGNPDLRPEASRSWSAGMIVMPHLLDGFRVSVDWTRIEKTDNIGNLSFNQTNLNTFESIVPGLVTRGPVAPGDPFGVGPITHYSTQLRNIERLEVEAVDFALDYRIRTESLGTFDLQAGATHTIHIKTKLTPTAPVTETAGVSGLLGDNGGLSWKVNGGLSWQKGNWSASWTGRYYDSYWLQASRAVLATQGAATVASQHYHDVFVGYRFVGHRNRLLAGSRLSVGIKNLLDRSPPIEAIGTSGGLYSHWGDPRLRSFVVSWTASL